MSAFGIRGVFRKLTDAYDVAVISEEREAAKLIKAAYRKLSGGCEPDSHSWGSGVFCYCGLEEWTKTG